MLLAMSENEADRQSNDESAHLLFRDVTVTSHAVDVHHNSECLQPSAVIGSTSGNDGYMLKGRRSSLLSTNGSLSFFTGFQRSLSDGVTRPSMDGVVQSEADSRVSLLQHHSSIMRTSNYGTLHSPVRQKLSALRRLSFAEVVEPITLTWENIDVYVPPTRSKPIVLRGLCASSANADKVQPKHILKDGKEHVMQNWMD